jgi:hypothetical protein
MTTYPAMSTRMLIGLVLLILIVSCSPKPTINGRVVDADTHKPIKGAAVAIRWIADASTPEHDRTTTFGAYQALSDDEGVFHLPQYTGKKYFLGVYKHGYICWSSQDVFLIDPDAAVKNKYIKRKGHRFGNRMIIELKPFNPDDYLRDVHAGFAVMVGGQSTDAQDGPFHQAIESEYRRWRESLRKDYLEKFGRKRVLTDRHRQSGD